jgi:hypothetical protein
MDAFDRFWRWAGAAAQEPAHRPGRHPPRGHVVAAGRSAEIAPSRLSGSGPKLTQSKNQTEPLRSEAGVRPAVT